MRPIKENQLYTTKEAGAFLKVSDSTVKRFLKKGIIKAYRVGGRHRIWGDEILKLVSPQLERRTFRIYKKIKDKTKETVANW